MVNIETGELIDLLESRDGKDVSEWLSSFPNLTVVSRDGSLTYATAITDAHPYASQISDRFHIVKNLSDACTKVMQRLFKGRIEIPIIPETAKTAITVLDKKSITQRYHVARELYASGKNITEISRVLHITMATVKKYISDKEEDIPKEKQTVRAIENENAMQKVNEKADKVKELHAKGYSRKAIIQETGFSKEAVKRYLSPDFSHIHGQYGTSRYESN